MTDEKLTLTERFIAIDGWPTGRKTALVMGLALVSHLADWAFLHLMLSGDSTYDLQVVDRLMAYGAVAFLVCLGAGLAVSWAGRPGEWTAYLFVVLGGGFFAAMPYVFGFFTSPLYAVLPITILLTALWYGRAAAVALFGFYSAVSIAVAVLQANGDLTKAPGLAHPTPALETGATWIASVMVPLQLVFAVAFVLSLLVIQARRLQETRIAEAQKQLQHSNWLISRYVPSQVAKRVMSEHGELPTQHERRRLTIFFSDLVGFTDIAEELEPEDLSRVLNEYFTEMTDIAERHGGTVDELQGDAILVLFGAPEATDDRDHAVRAVRMAIEMQAMMETLNARWARYGIGETIAVRMGINTGVVTIGNFGSPQRMKYAALGKHVNLAARLQTNCEPGKVLFSHATWLLTQEEVPSLRMGEVTLKGIVKPVMTYTPDLTIPSLDVNVAVN